MSMDLEHADSRAAEARRQRSRAALSDRLLHRFLQPHAAAFFPWIPLADGVRARMFITSGCPLFRRKSPVTSENRKDKDRSIFPIRHLGERRADQVRLRLPARSTEVWHATT